MTIDLSTSVKSTTMVAMATTINRTNCVFLHKDGVYDHHFAQICNPFVWLAR